MVGQKAISQKGCQVVFNVQGGIWLPGQSGLTPQGLGVKIGPNLRR